MVRPDRPQMTIQYGAQKCDLHAGYLRQQHRHTCTNTDYLLFFVVNNGYTKTPQCYQCLVARYMYFVWYRKTYADLTFWSYRYKNHPINE